MGIDLRNDKGELDRSKVLRELTRRNAIVLPMHRQNLLIDLVDEVQKQAWQDGYVEGNQDDLKGIRL
jgi:hypothetical protein